MRLATFLAGILVAGGVLAAGDGAAGLIAEADNYWAAGRLEEAQQSFEAAVAAEPDSAAPLLRLAGFHLSQMHGGASIAGYQRAIGLEPRNTRAWLGLGLAYLHGGRKDLARASFDEAIRIDPQQKERLAGLVGGLERD
ncbi:MAG TPA: tetratricopeptide repeat protein [Rhodocyclaceae bacterium]|nr:tetratricopeptide repeat protein [Rhodocyclaceae bacterium]